MKQFGCGGVLVGFKFVVFVEVYQSVWFFGFVCYDVVWVVVFE